MTEISDVLKSIGNATTWKNSIPIKPSQDDTRY
jgi:hypothetical protein